MSTGNATSRDMFVFKVANADLGKRTAQISVAKKVAGGFASSIYFFH